VLTGLRNRRIHVDKPLALLGDHASALAGEEKDYYPDFVVHLDDGQGEDDLLNMIVEVTGQEGKDKEIKVATMRNLWVPAVNNHGGFGRWAFTEIRDP